MKTKKSIILATYLKTYLFNFRTQLNTCKNSKHRPRTHRLPRVPAKGEVRLGATFRPKHEVSNFSNGVTQIRLIFTNHTKIKNGENVEKTN